MKDVVIPTEFSEQITNESLVYDSTIGGYITNSQMLPSPTSLGRGWVYFDDATVGSRIVVDISAEQTSKVSVIGASSYTVDYVNGAIKNPNTTPSAVSYYWNYVSVLPHWPGTTPPPLPLVTLGIDLSEKAGFQLGGGHRNIRTVYFNIFATSPSERDDLTELILSYIHDRTVSILDFNDGEYLNYDGTFNTNLSLPLSSIGSMFFTSVTHRNVYASADWSDINSYRSVVTGNYESFVEGPNS